MSELDVENAVEHRGGEAADEASQGTAGFSKRCDNSELNAFHANSEVARAVIEEVLGEIESNLVVPRRNREGPLHFR